MVGGISPSAHSTASFCCAVFQLPAVVVSLTPQSKQIGKPTHIQVHTPIEIFGFSKLYPLTAPTLFTFCFGHASKREPTTHRQRIDNDSTTNRQRTDAEPTTDRQRTDNRPTTNRQDRQGTTAGPTRHDVRPVLTFARFVSALVRLVLALVRSSGIESGPSGPFSPTGLGPMSAGLRTGLRPRRTGLRPKRTVLKPTRDQTRAQTDRTDRTQPSPEDRTRAKTDRAKAKMHRTKAHKGPD